jgi:antitoxin ParD1/3/4
MISVSWLEVTAMNVSLTPQLEAFVKQKVETGMYNSASEVIREALRLLEEHDALQAAKREALRKDLRAGLASLDGGEGRALDVEAIKAKGRRLRP